MAKRKPTLTLVEMERELGYNVDSLTHPAEALRRFYSDLRPVADSAYERIKKEFEEYEKKKYHKHDGNLSEKALRELEETQDTVVLSQRSHVGFYRFPVDIHYAFGFHFPMLFTKDEAFKTISVAKLQPSGNCDATPMFFNLPRESRDNIYSLALPEGKWSIQDVDQFDEVNFAGSIGDPGGFYFPLSKDLGVLRVNRQMRQEALPLAYRRTTFHLDDMDDLLKLLIAVGETGRDNIESLDFPWESRSDSECKWDEDPDSDHFLTLPHLHVMKCVQLLKQCKRLRFLGLYFKSELIRKMTTDAFKADSGIQELCSLRIERVEIMSLSHESLEQCRLAKWLKEEMEGSRRPEGGRK